MKRELLRRAIALAGENIEKGGGPFGAVIVRNGEVIAEAVNRVTLENDPTAHAEVEAIRQAGKVLGNFDLSDCEIYASCEPCPMCLGAIYWARIPVVYYASDRKEAEAAGFDDSLIYEELEKDPGARKLVMEQVAEPEAAELFKKWTGKSDKTAY